MPDAVENAADAMAALERFVVENDELLELEALIGRFNIFDALRVVDVEIRHSNFLAWLLDPAESHGQGALFLKALLMDLFKSARENGFPCPVSPVELDGEDLRGVEIRREWKRIDLLIRCDQPRFVIAIENKIRSAEHGDQLARYRETVEGEFGDTPSMYVFLTIEGDEPSEDDWVPYSYGDVHRVLLRVRNANETSIGDDVRAFLDHYLRLIRGRLMDDPKIEDLCQRIYKNHRQAIDLIVEHIAGPDKDIALAITEVIRSDQETWIPVLRTRRNVVYFAHRPTLAVLPAVHPTGRVYDQIEFGDRCWIYFCITVNPDGCSFWAGARPTTDDDIRQSVLERLTRDKSEFGFRRKRKTTTASWPTLTRESWIRWQDERPDVPTIIQTIERKLARLKERLAAVPAALRPIIAEWELQRQME